MANLAGMPEDWDDLAAWEDYYQKLPSHPFWHDVAVNDSSRYSWVDHTPFIKFFRSQRWRNIWFPGCGISKIVLQFAQYGFVVHATDIAPTAISHQAKNASLVKPAIVSATETSPETQACGELNARVHDFRTPLDTQVDVIFNLRSLQGLPGESLWQAARIQAQALRPGGFALVKTMNVQGNGRDFIETALVDAGFYVPLYNLNQRYRRSLDETGIPYVLINNAPVIPGQPDPDFSDEPVAPEVERDMKTLRPITEEYLACKDKEYKREQTTLTKNTIRAQVIHCTG